MEFFQYAKSTAAEVAHPDTDLSVTRLPESSRPVLTALQIAAYSKGAHFLRTASRRLSEIRQDDPVLWKRELISALDAERPIASVAARALLKSDESSSVPLLLQHTKSLDETASIRLLQACRTHMNTPEIRGLVLAWATEAAGSYPSARSRNAFAHTLIESVDNPLAQKLLLTRSLSYGGEALKVLLAAIDRNQEVRAVLAQWVHKTPHDTMTNTICSALTPYATEPAVTPALILAAKRQAIPAENSVELLGRLVHRQEACELLLEIAFGVSWNSSRAYYTSGPCGGWHQSATLEWTWPETIRSAARETVNVYLGIPQMLNAISARIGDEAIDISEFLATGAANPQLTSALSVILIFGNDKDKLRAADALSMVIQDQDVRKELLDVLSWGRSTAVDLALRLLEGRYVKGPDRPRSKSWGLQYDPTETRASSWE